MTDASLFYESDVTVRSLYQFSGKVRVIWPRFAASITFEPMTVDLETSNRRQEWIVGWRPGRSRPRPAIEPPMRRWWHRTKRSRSS